MWCTTASGYEYAHCWLIGACLILVGCSTPQSRIAADFATSGHWDDAVSAYRQALKRDPFSLELQAQLQDAKQRAADQHYQSSRRLYAEHHVLEALAEIKHAMGYIPTNNDHQSLLADILRAQTALEQLQLGKKYQTVGRHEEAVAAFTRALEADPYLDEAAAGITTLTIQAKTPGGSNASKPITLKFQNAKLKEVFEIVARTAGVNVIFDKEIRDEPVTLFIKDMTFEDALNLILNTNNLVSQRVGPDTLLILPNNKQKLAQYQDLMVQTFYLTHAKAKDAVNVVRTLLDSKKIYVDEKVNAIIIREEPVKLQLAERMIRAIDREEPEVELDLEVLEVDRTKSMKYGLNFAKLAGAGIIPGGTTGGLSTAPTAFTFQQLTSLGTGSYLFSFPASVLLDFFKQESDAKTLAAPKLRVLNNRSASINVGDKQPILLSTTNVLPGQAVTGALPTTSTVTSVEFKDVGVKLTVEPSIALNNELTLKLKVEVTRLGDQVTLQASPEIKQFKFGNRSAETVLQLKDDETVVLAGLLQDEQRRSRNKVPWLEGIPWLDKLFTSTSEDTLTTEVVVTITPHIVRKMSLPSADNQAYWSGTESTYASTQLFPMSATPLALRMVEPSSATTSEKVRQPTPQSGESFGPTFERSALSGVAAPLETAGQAASKREGTEPQSLLPPLPGLPHAATTAVATSKPPLVLRPTKVTVAPSQEFRLDITTEQLERLHSDHLILTFDPQGIEYLRMAPVMSNMTASAGTGQVGLTLTPRGGQSGPGVLAMLFFKSKSPGHFTVAIGDGVAPTGAPEVAVAIDVQ